MVGFALLAAGVAMLPSRSLIEPIAQASIQSLERALTLSLLGRADGIEVIESSSGRDA